MNEVVIPAPWGSNLKLNFLNDVLFSIDFTDALPTLPSNYSASIQQTLDELFNYFQNPKHTFSIACTPNGTPFQQAVWEKISAIPSGQPQTYKQLATTLKTSPRAIGNACRANPLPIIVPCHRVVGKNTLGGYTGETTGPLMNIKQWLLQHEAV